MVASPVAQFGLPEVSVGLYAAAGGLPRILRTCGLQVASEIAMTGRRLTAKEALDYRLVNKISRTSESLIAESVDMGRQIASMSPDAIVVTRHALREAMETGSVERATQLTSARFDKDLFEGPNVIVGLEAFASKAKPQWLPSKI